MSKSKTPFALLSKKKILTTSAIAVAGLAGAPGATAIDPGADSTTANKGNASVTICHNGRDMQVSLMGTIGHLVHGDSIGSCGGGDTGGRGL